MLKRNFIYSGILFILLVLFNSCGDSSSTPTEKAWFYEDEFSKNSALHAKIENTILLDISSSQQPNSSEEHSVRYEYEESGAYVFCIDSNEKYIEKMTFVDENSNVMLSLQKGDGCKNLYLDAGRYSMQITHDAAKVPEKGTVAFIHHPSNTDAENLLSDMNLTADSNPPYYSLQVTNDSYDGQYLAAKSMDFLYYSKDRYSPYVFPDKQDFLAVVPLSESSNFKERRHLFTLKKDDMNKEVIEGYDWIPNQLIYGACVPERILWTENNDEFFCVDSQDESNLLEFPTKIFMSFFEHWPKPDPSNPNPKSVKFTMDVSLYLKQEADETYELWYEGGGFVPPSDSSLYAAENSLMYRTGASKGSSDSTKFTMNKNMPLYKDGSSYALQAGEVALSESCDLKGATYIVDSNISEIPKAARLVLAQIKSIKLGGDYTTLSLFGEKDYGTPGLIVGMDEGCLSTPIDLEAVGSLKVFNAKKVFLSSHQCDYCNLAGADLSNRSLNDVSLRYANLANTKFNNSKLEKSDMRYAKLYGANLNETDLTGSTLCGASLNGNSLSNSNGATLEGAQLKNVNLAYSNLSEAKFTDANFYSTTSSGCIPADCGFTTCASAAYATINGTTFTNTYMTGADFSHSTIFGSNFVEAVLVGASFNNAKIGSDKAGSGSTTFSGAFLQGADFSDANVKNTSFSNAYVDLDSSGHTMIFNLQSAHATFAGWMPLSEPICTWYAYSIDANQTVVPPTDETCICPNGDSGGCDTFAWTHPTISMDKSTQGASYCEDGSCIPDANYTCWPPNIYW